MPNGLGRADRRLDRLPRRGPGGGHHHRGGDGPDPRGALPAPRGRLRLPARPPDPRPARPRAASTSWFLRSTPGMTRPARSPTANASSRRPVRTYLESHGYRVWVDPDGTDYYDIIARRGRDDRPRRAQALRWPDGPSAGATAPRLGRLGRGGGAQRAARPADRRVGPWRSAASGSASGRSSATRSGSSGPPRPFVGPGETDPFERLKASMHERLDLLEAGTLPEGVAWHLLATSRRELPGRRSTRDWRLEEFRGDGSGTTPAGSADGEPRTPASRPSNASAIFSKVRPSAYVAPALAISLRRWGTAKSSASALA